MSITSSPKYQHGMGMIESLVALLVISIGLLGIAALQLSGMQQSASAHWHSQAVWISYEMSDRIAASGADNFNQYDNIDTELDYDMDCQANPCTVGQMRDADAQDWADMVESLPGGRGITRLSNANTMMIAIMWQDNSGESNCINNETNDPNMTCYTVTITP